MGVFSSIGHVARLARAGYVLAREGVFRDIDLALVPVGAQPALAMANLLARRPTEPG